MKDSRPNKHVSLQELTPELMEGYLNGTLPSQQRMQVEQFLRDNPFEAEAMEGLQASSVSFTDDLKELENRLTRKTSRSVWKQYWPMAAAVSVMLIAGFLFYFLRPLDPVASQVSIVQDSATVLAEQQRTETTSQPKNIELEEEPSLDKKVEEDLDPSQEVPVVASNKEESPIPEISDAGTSSQKSATEIISDEVNEPLALGRTNQTAVLDLTEDDISSEEAEISQGDPAPEVYREKRKKTLSTAPAASSRSQPLDLPNGQAPKDLEEYLIQNTSYPEEAKSKAVSGVVLVSFVINPDGKLTDFKIVKGLGHGCDEEAIRILQEGPRWIPAEINGATVQSRGTSEVHFPAVD